MSNIAQLNTKVDASNDVPLEYIIREGVMEITPELARRIVKDSIYQNQRKISRITVERYAEIMRRGNWCLADPISFVKLADKLYFVNGYHRMDGVSTYGHPVKFRVAITEVNSEDELKETFWLYDVNIRVRTPNQILGAIDFAGGQDLQKTISKAVYDASPIILSRFNIQGHQEKTIAERTAERLIDLRIEECENWWEEARLLQACFENAEKAIKLKLTRPGAFATALLTMKHQKKLACNFWKTICDNDGLDRTDIRSVYRRDLIARRIHATWPMEGAIAAARAWNNWANDEHPIASINVRHSSKFALWGVPRQEFI